MKFNTTCPRCGGTGKARTVSNVCGGNGVVNRQETITVRIKPGTRDGQRIDWRARGMPVHVARSRRFVIIIRAGGHPVFDREGDDIRLTVPVSPTEAALGAKVEVPTIDGRALLRIPPGTQSGQKLRLREKAFRRRPGRTSRRRDRRDQDHGSACAGRAFEGDPARVGEAVPEDPRAELWKQI